jgi:membrane protease YdiL (CAAX protease family)
VTDSPSLWEHLLALVAGVLLPLSGALQHRKREIEASAELETRDKLVMYWANAGILALFALLVLLAWRHAGRTIDELGLTAAPQNLGAGLALAFAFLGLYAFDARRAVSAENLAETRARWQRNTPFMPASRRELAHSLVMVASAALFEEIVYRGFLIRYVQHFTGTETAVAIPALVFAAGHYYQGWTAMLKIVLLAGIFGAILVVTGSLWIPIALHFVVDLVGALLGPRLLGRPVSYRAR